MIDSDKLAEAILMPIVKSSALVENGQVKWIRRWLLNHAIAMFCLNFEPKNFSGLPCS